MAFVSERQWNDQGQIVIGHLDTLFEKSSLVGDKLYLDDEMSYILGIAGCFLCNLSICVQVVDIYHTLDVYIGLAIGLWH